LGNNPTPSRIIPDRELPGVTTFRTEGPAPVRTYDSARPGLWHPNGQPQAPAVIYRPPTGFAAREPRNPNVMSGLVDWASVYGLPREGSDAAARLLPPLPPVFRGIGEARHPPLPPLPPVLKGIGI
jgi:hypothetical protein